MNDKHCKWLTSVEKPVLIVFVYSDLEAGVEGSGLAVTCFVGYAKG